MMRAAALAALLVSTALAAAAWAPAWAPAWAQSSRSVTFDTVRLGTVPPAFDCGVTGPGGPARWAVTQALADGGIRRIFAQTSQIASPDRMPLCLLRRWDAVDVDVAALVRPVSGGQAEAGGLVWRGLDGENFYALVLDGRGGRLAALRVDRGRLTPLPVAGERGRYAVAFRVERDRWYQLRARITGTRFEFFVDGAKRFEVEDGAIRGAGAVGLVTLSDSVVQFDAFSTALSR